MCLRLMGTLSYKHSLDCVRVLLRKREDANPKHLAHINSGQDESLLLSFHFCFSQRSSAYIAAGRKLPVPEGVSNSKQSPAGHRPVDKKL